MNNGQTRPAPASIEAPLSIHLSGQRSVTPAAPFCALSASRSSSTLSMAPPASPPRPSSSRSAWFHSSASRPRTSPGPRPGQPLPDELKRDSGFAPSLARPSTAGNASGHAAITTDIPKADFDDLVDDRIAFSKRGTLLLDGRRLDRTMQHNDKRRSLVGNVQVQQHGETSGSVPWPCRELALGPIGTALETASMPELTAAVSLPTAVAYDGQTSTTVSAAPSRATSLAPHRSISDARVLSADETLLSKKVRSMYQNGDETAVDWAVDPSIRVDGPVEEEQAPAQHATEGDSLCAAISRRNVDGMLGTSIASRPASVLSKEPHEVAGGMEDWEDIEGGDVDRYGFIIGRKSELTDRRQSAATFVTPRLRRVSTQLQLASEAPRRKRALHRTPSTARSSTVRSSRSTFAARHERTFSNQSLHPPESAHSLRSTGPTHPNLFRTAANRLPHNRSRRLVDEASDMLTLPPGLAAIAEEKDGRGVVETMKRKEWQREEKWRKMASLVDACPGGGGMLFEFDTRNPRLIDRTWKGIPDKWRSTAWYSFLSTSAKRNDNGASDDELVKAFYTLQEKDSAEDMQIDMDVPRTISHHIMFRRRYRGGQRLLFRVLHAFSLYLPGTGYVQGMATLAATLLCYYDEERAFIMLVRLWKLRGLERLYEHGFGGLMEALGDFERHWLARGEMAEKLEELGVHCTAYGTRWYLTLFNYSIPFPAQLRVWDVFMLLGDATTSCEPDNSFHADLDVLHATSAALIDATREILLDSDFETAMKTLTSWIPVKDEDLLMRVARAEWKQRKRRAKGKPGVG